MARKHKIIYGDIVKKDYSKLNKYRDRRGTINLKRVSDTTPCPVCGTILIELLKYKLGEYVKKRKKEKNEKEFFVCWVCCQKLIDPPIEKKPKSIRPRGWQFMNVFVDKDGNVYHKGEEQEDLKGTLPPTTWTEKPKKKKKRKQKLSRWKREELKQEKFSEINKLKKQLKDETRKSYKKQFQNKIKKLQKELLKIR